MLSISSFFLAKALVLAELKGGKIAPATLAAVTAATKLGPVTALVSGPAAAKEAAGALSKVKGVQEVLLASQPQYEHGMPEEVAPLVSKIVKDGQFTHVVAATSAFSKGVIPRAAAVADSMPIAEAVKIEDESTFVRLSYAGNVVKTVKSKDAIKFVTIRGTSFERAASEGGSGKVTSLEAVPAPVGIATWEKDLIESSNKPDLTTSPVVIAGGRGLKSGDNFKLLDALAAPLKAAVGATRAVVDAGYVPNDMQIGQTGKTVAPTLYIAAGVSGAIQHVAGMKDAKVIAVINTDEEAPFFQIADYGLVGDLFDAVPKLTELIKKQ